MLALVWFACGPEGPAVPVANDPRRVVDVNGDGFADVLSPVRDPDGSGGEPGHVAAWFGPVAAGATPVLVPVDDGSPLLPSYVVAVGDVDGDGTTDVVYTEYGVDADPIAHGLAGGADGPGPAFGEALEDPGASTTGARAFWVGDVDGDGLDDVGVLREDTFAVYLAAGGVAGAPEIVLDFDAMPGWHVPEEGVQNQHARWITGVGDLDGDGADDLVVWWAGVNSNTSSTFVETWLYVAFGGDLFAEAWVPVHEVIPALFAHHNVGVTPSGDVDGDGAPDLLLADPNPAAAYSGSGYAGAEFSVARPAVNQALFEGAGDVNADGFADLLLRRWVDVASMGPGADAFDHEGAELYLGGPDGFAPGQEAAWTTAPPPYLTEREPEYAWRFGIWGGAVGDVDGDGFDDVTVATDVDVWLWHGGPRGARKDDAGTQLFANYLEPYGLATRAVAP